MKELLLQTAKRTGLVDAKQLAGFLEKTAEGNSRLDEVLLRCPYFTEEQVLKLFAAALGWPRGKASLEAGPGFDEGLPRSAGEENRLAR